MLRDGRQVEWGSAEQSKQKAEVLAELLTAVDAKHYDVSVPGQPTTPGAVSAAMTRTSRVALGRVATIWAPPVPTVVTTARLT